MTNKKPTYLELEDELSRLNKEIKILKSTESTDKISEANLKVIIENSLESICSIDTNYRIQYVNEVFARSFEQSFGVLLSKGVNLVEALPESLRPLWKERYDRAFNNEQFVFTYKIDLGDSAIYIEVSMNPILVEGKVIGASFYGKNISEQKKYEIQLIAAKEKAEENEKRLHDVIDKSLAGYFYIDRQGLFRYVNTAWLKMHKYDNANEVIDKHFAITQIDTDLERAQKIVEELFNGSVIPTGEFSRRCKDNSIGYHFFSANPVVKHKKIIGIEGFMIDNTASKLAEEKLHKFDERVRTSMDNLMEGSQIIGFDWRFLYLNNSAAKQGRKSKDEFIGYTIMEVLPGIENTELFTVLNRVMEERKTQHMINEFTYNDGSIGWFELSIQPVEEGIFILSMDITERKQSELLLKEKNEEIETQIEKYKLINEELRIAKEKVEENEAKYRKLSNLTFEGIIIHENGIVIDSNQSLTNLLGYSHGELLGKNVIDALVSEKYRSIIYKNIGNKSIIPYEIEVIKKDGSLFPVEVEGKSIESKDGNKNIRVAAIRDISQRKKTEKEIIKLSTAVNQSSNAVIITDTNGDIEYINPKFTELTGYTAQEVLGQNTRILKAGTQPNEYYAEMWQTITAGKIWRGEFNNKKKNGDYYWESVTITPIKNEAGEITNFLGIKEDITALKENEQKIQQQYKELVTAKEKAEESDRLKSAFLANMSHEIRTPMNGILGFAELLKAPNLTGIKQQEFIGIIEKSGVRLLNIINDIIDISKIESGQMEVNMKESNINELIEYIYTFFKPEIEGKGMQFSFKNSFSLKEAIIKTDHDKLFVILSNLVKNAIKFSEGGSIEFGYTKKDKNLEFYVKDTGIGIEKGRQEAIFKRFVQGDIADKDARQGAGLGLAISKAFVEMLGGKLWMESEKGKGSIFYFTIPYNSEPQETSKITKGNTNGDMKNQIKNLKILIVEDDKISNILLNMMLEKISREVLHAKSGFEAIELCSNNPDIDLVLMDIKMPEMDGYEATRQIRQFNKNVVIIAQTAYGLFGDREKAIDSGCNEYLSKPIIKNKLLSLIQQYFVK